MSRGFDYTKYGAFKGYSRSSADRLRRFARRAGLRSRYLRFARSWDRRAPVVELGAGEGTFLDDLRGAGFVDVKGCDLSTSYIPRADIAIVSAMEFMKGLPDGSVGNIVAFDLFEHISVDDLHVLLAIARQKLRSGGVVLCRVPNAGSPLGLMNQFGDQSHVTTFTEVSLRQLAFAAGLHVSGIREEPVAYPRSIAAVVGLALWPLYRAVTKAVLAAFGQHPKVLTPNLVGMLTKR